MFLISVISAFTGSSLTASFWVSSRRSDEQTFNQFYTVHLMCLKPRIPGVWQRPEATMMWSVELGSRGGGVGSRREILRFSRWVGARNDCLLATIKIWVIVLSIGRVSEIQLVVYPTVETINMCPLFKSGLWSIKLSFDGTPYINVW